MSAKVRGLGHIGFYVQGLDLRKDFYANFMGMTLTKGKSVMFFVALGRPQRRERQQS